MKFVFTYVLVVWATIWGAVASSTPSASPEPRNPAALSPEAIDWIKSNYQDVHGKEYQVYIDEYGNTLASSRSMKVNNTVDYMQLLASDLLTGYFGPDKLKSNKWALMQGFILYAIIQGQVFPVSPIPATEKESPLMKKAAKIAAYAMTYRMGLKTKELYGDGAIMRKDIGGGLKTENGDFLYQSLIKDKEYKKDSLLGRSGVKAKLELDTTQANALNDAWQVLKSVSDKIPDDDLFKYMYNLNNQKRRVQALTPSLPLLTKENFDSVFALMDIFGSDTSGPSVSGSATAARSGSAFNKLFGRS